jgi:hypothetical protein
LEVYQNNFPYFIYHSSISIEVSGQDEEIEAMPNGTAQEEEVKTKEPHDFSGGIAHEAEVHTKKP